MKGKAEDIGMKRLCSILLALLLLLGACSGEESKNGLPQENLPIGFSGVITMTRGTGKFATAGELKNVGVFAYFTHGKFNENTAIPNFMYNQLVEKQQDEGTWSYSPVKFWSDNSTTDKISFFAYAPHNATGVTPSNAIQKGYPSFTYTTPTAEADQVDLLAATPIINQNGGSVDFKMQHALTKVVFNVKSNDDITGKVITAFSITGAKSGTLAFHVPANDDDKGFGWTYPSTVTAETFTATTKSLSVPDKSTPEEAMLCTYFLLPTNIGNTFNITYTYIGIKGTQTVTLTNQPLPSLDKWLSGAFVSYTIGIDKKVVTATTESHPTWGNGGQGSVDGTIN